MFYDPLDVESLSEFPAQSLGAQGVPGRALPEPYPPSGLGDLPAVFIDGLADALQTGVSTVSSFLFVDPDAVSIYSRRVTGTPQNYSPQLQRRGLDVGHIADTFLEKGPFAALKDTLSEMDAVTQIATILGLLYLGRKLLA